MTDKLPPIYFYIPQRHWAEIEMPQTPDEYWNWNISIKNKWNWGRYQWTLQTYLHLKADGFPCELVDTLPAEGIVLAFRDFFPTNMQPPPKLLLVCLQGDRFEHPYAQVHVVQNSRDEKFKRSPELWCSHYIPLWPQPSLIPRDLVRNDRFENVAFVGNDANLAPELKQPSWHEKVKSLGLSWTEVDRLRWHDYSEIDAIVAVRSFDDQDYTLKPPSKLYNCWLAGVPAILGRESAYQVERKNELDYIEVGSVDDVVAALVRLRDDKTFRHAMVENGLLRAQEVQPEKLVKMWRTFITDVAVPAYDRWRNASSLNRQIFLKRRYLASKADRVKQIMRSLVPQGKQVAS